MRVVLLRRFKRLGYPNDIIEVADGYARNYLFPNGIAIYASEGAIKSAKENIKQSENKLKKERDEYLKLADDLKGKTVVIKVKVNSANKLFARVTDSVVENAVVKLLDGREIAGVTISNKILQLGTYHARVKLYKDVVADINVEIEKA